VIRGERFGLGCNNEVLCKLKLGLSSGQSRAPERGGPSKLTASPHYKLELPKMGTLQTCARPGGLTLATLVFLSMTMHQIDEASPYSL